MRGCDRAGVSLSLVDGVGKMVGCTVVDVLDNGSSRSLHVDCGAGCNTMGECFFGLGVSGTMPIELKAEWARE